MEWNHVGIFPYLMKFRKTVFSEPEYNMPSNLSKLSAWKLSWVGYTKWKADQLGNDVSVVIDGLIHPITQSLLMDFKRQLDKPVKSMIIIPSNMQLGKIWWLDKMICYYPRSRIDKTKDFTIVFETKLSPVDLKKVNIGSKRPFKYPVCIHTGATNSQFRAERFSRTSNEHKAFPHAFDRGTICMGNYAGDIEDAFQDNNPIKLAAILIEYAGRFNPDDPLGRSYSAFLTTPPRCCSICGRTDNYLYDIPEGYSCDTCYYLPENCRYCGAGLTRNDTAEPHLHDGCVRVMNPGWIRAPYRCDHCGSETNLAPYIYIDDRFCYLCEECADYKKFEHRSPLGRAQTSFIRRF